MGHACLLQVEETTRNRGSDRDGVVRSCVPFQIFLRRATHTRGERVYSSEQSQYTSRAQDTRRARSAQCCLAWQIERHAWLHSSACVQWRGRERETAGPLAIPAQKTRVWVTRRGGQKWQHHNTPHTQNLDTAASQHLDCGQQQEQEVHGARADRAIRAKHAQAGRRSHAHTRHTHSRQNPSDGGGASFCFVVQTNAKCSALC